MDNKKHPPCKKTKAFLSQVEEHRTKLHKVLQISLLKMKINCYALLECHLTKFCIVTNWSTAQVTQRSRVRITFKPDFFSGFLTAAQVASITLKVSP